MAKRAGRITAQWDCEWVEQADNNLAVATFKLAPYNYFGDQFNVKELAESPVAGGDISPHRVTVTATVSRQLFRLMFRYQAGSEAMGDDPPDWALVESSAVDADTGEAVDPHSV